MVKTLKTQLVIIVIWNKMIEEFHPYCSIRGETSLCLTKKILQK